MLTNQSGAAEVGRQSSVHLQFYFVKANANLNTTINKSDSIAIHTQSFSLGVERNGVMYSLIVRNLLPSVIHDKAAQGLW